MTIKLLTDATRMREHRNFVLSIYFNFYQLSGML